MKTAHITTTLPAADRTVAPGFVRVSIRHEHGLLQFVAFAKALSGAREAGSYEAVRALLSMVDDYRLDIVRDVLDADGSVTIDGLAVDGDVVRNAMDGLSDLRIAA